MICFSPTALLSFTRIFAAFAKQMNNATHSFDINAAKDYKLTPRA